LITVPAAGAAAALVGTLFGIPSLRVKGLYLAIATLAAHPIMEWVALHLIPKLTVAGTARSSLPVPRPSLDLGFYSQTIRSDTDRYYLFGFLAILGILFAENLLRTRIGRAWVAIRDNEIAAESIGVSVYRYKLMAFALSACYAGVAGALVSYNLRAVTHEAFGVDLTVQYLTMVIIGGLGTLPGSVLGAGFVVLLPIVIRDQVVTPAKDMIPRITQYYAFVQQIMFGVLILIFIILEPDGLYRLWTRARRSFQLWPFSR
jgi:branched-chain amino acid transport system permease protein